MKVHRYLALLAGAAMMILAASCDKVTQEDPENKDPEQEKPVEKSKECKLLTFSLKVGDKAHEGFVYDEDHVAEIVYMPGQKAMFAKATAVVTISEKATIAPKPDEVRDYTVEGGVVFTVTAEDGKTKQEYKVVLKEAKVKVTCKEVWKKTYGDLDISVTGCGQPNVGFSGDKFVTRNMEVLDLEGKKVGTLNLDGIQDATNPNFGLVCMSNDHKNHLVATVSYDKSGKFSIFTDDNKKPEYANNSKVYVWEKGWDKAPTLIYESKEGDLSRYMSAGGDLPKEGIVTLIAGRNITQMHHCDVFTDGKLAWNAFNTKYPGNDGNWGQIVSPASGDPNGYFFIADSQGKNQGAHVMSRTGIKGNDVDLFGSMLDDETVAKEHAGMYQYGNYSTTHARAFMLNGKAYAAVTSSGWPSTYLTIQSDNPDDEDHFILRTVVFAAGQPVPCSAVYMAPSGEVYVLMSTQSSTPMMALYKIVTEAA